MRKIGRYLIETPRNREKPITTVIFTSRKLPNHKLLKTMLAPQHPSIPHTFDVGVEIQFPRMQGVNLVISVSIATHWTAIRSWWCSLFYNDDHEKKKLRSLTCKIKVVPDCRRAFTVSLRIYTCAPHSIASLQPIQSVWWTSESPPLSTNIQIPTITELIKIICA